MDKAHLKHLLLDEMNWTFDKLSAFSLITVVFAIKVKEFRHLVILGGWMKDSRKWKKADNHMNNISKERWSMIKLTTFNSCYCCTAYNRWSKTTQTKTTTTATVSRREQQQYLPLLSTFLAVKVLKGISVVSCLVSSKYLQ